MGHRSSSVFTPLMALAVLAAGCPNGIAPDDDDDETPTNRAPSVGSVTLEPTFPHTDEEVTATAEATDPEDDVVTLHYTWFSGDEPIDGAPDAPDLDGDDHFDKGERVSVEVVAVDAGGLESSAVRSADVEVLNSMPGVPQLSITSGLTAGITDIVCSIALESTDADGDEVSYTFRWELDFAPWDGTPSTTTRPDDTIPGAVTTSGDIFGCHVEASDGTDEASEVTTSVTVP